jgi:hypothetical protein
MYADTKCIIDNWSLEHAAILLDGSYDYFQSPPDVFSNHIGGLSNYINAALLYKSASYLANGFEGDWTKFSWFTKNNTEVLDIADPNALGIKWRSSESYADKGIANYLLVSKFSDSDLFLSPERASEFKLVKQAIINETFVETLNGIDKKIEELSQRSWYQNINVGVNNNFSLPSLTQYVLSLVSRQDEIFTILSQLKTDGKVQRVYDRIEEISLNSQKAGKLQRELELIVNHEFGDNNKASNFLSLKIPVYFLSITIPVTLNFFNRKEHLIFLKTMIESRTEANNLSESINRIFKRKPIR